MKQTVSRLVMGAGLLALVLSGCSSPPATSEPPTATPMPSGRVDIGGYSLFYTCRGQGSPTVILESGGGADSAAWLEVMRGIDTTTRVCAYDRANLGRSGPSSKPRTFEDSARDLEALLAAARLDGPYILVGHSIGGELVRVFADEHPDQLAGMVLVDAAHPDMGARLMAGLPPASGDEPEAVAFWRQLFTWISDSSGSSYPNPEGWDTQASHAQVRATDPLGDLPLVVISQSPDRPLSLSSIPSALADTNAGLQQIWQEMQKELVGLSSSSSQVIATQAGHDIPNEEPELIIEAIRKLVSEARRG